MTIYRIHPDRMHYQLMTISSEEIISKLGKQNPFHIDPTPRPYTHIWKPLEISFYDSTTGKNKAKQPDITLDHGRLFLNNAGCDALSKLIETDGELLPVFFEGQSGAIFNTLKCAEDLNALDAFKLAVEQANLKGITFSVDLGNIFPPDTSAQEPLKQ